MKIGIMQPYLFPYIGYFQLISAVDLFIVYDNVKYTKKGWINRNRFLQNGKEALFSIPLKKDSDFSDIRDRELDNNFNKGKFLNQIKEAYRRAPYFAQTFHLIEEVIQFNDSNLFRYLHNSLLQVCKYLKIDSEIAISSNIQIDHSLKSRDKVIALCKEVGAEIYINAIGGMELYSKDDFKSNGVQLFFIRAKPFNYRQFENDFIPWLSIIDVMMFNSVDAINECLAYNYELI